MSETSVVEVPRVLLERLLDRVDDLEAELNQYREANERDKATIRQDVHEAIEKGDQPDGADDAQNDETSSHDGSTTPMERLIQLGEHGVMADVTASVRRAKAIACHFREWASKTPNGLVVKDNLKSLLGTATGERLAWKQVYRAARALEKFTKGQVRFEKHRRHGWMLIAEPAIVTRLERASSAPGG